MEDDPGHDMGNAGVALALVVLAGGATSIGAAVVYVPALVNLANSNTLAISLGLSAGVMIFVSYVEIFAKSQDAFVEAGYDDDKAYALAMLTFFAGCVMMIISQWLIETAMGGHSHGHDRKQTKAETKSSTKETQDAEAPKRKRKSKNELKRTTTIDTLASSGKSEEIHEDCQDCHETNPLDNDDDWGTMMLPCCDHEEDLREKIKSFQDMAQEMHEYEDKKKDVEACIESGIPETEVLGNERFHGLTEEEQKRKENNRMMHMSYKTAFAIALHNFPEGLATFVAALGDPKVGLVLAVAIAIHNIPEGLAVALPMYYATGNRTRAFLYGALSGCTEIFAALLGWAVLANAFSAVLYAVIFGITAGMMVIISVRELLPTAHRYDPEDRVVTFSFTVGMIVMALSLALIALFG